MGVQVDPAVSNNKRSSTLSFENLGEQSSSDESTTINSTKSLASYADSVPSVGSVLSSDSIPSTDSVQYHCRNPYVIRLGFKTVCALALLPPMGALIVVFAVGVVFDFSELFNYDWNNCGLTKLPSVSRIINLPTERTVFGLAICFHTPFIPLISYLKWKMLVRKQGKPLRKGTANAYLISGLVEEIGLVGLTLVGERENGSGHVVFFCTFLFAAWTHFSTETVLSSNSKKNAASFQIRMVLLSIFHLLVAGVVTTFFAHLLFCTPFSYEVFASLEYLTVIVIFAFHSIVLLDDGLKNVIFSCVNVNRSKSHH